MFFSIGSVPQENYPCHWQMGSFSVSTDQGWKQTTLDNKKVLYKGYTDSNSLEMLLEQIISQSEPELTGNFCALVLHNNNIEIHTDRYRSFPIYIGLTVNNLVPSEHTAWTDSLIVVHPDLTVTESKFDVIGPIDVNPLTPTQAAEKITSILDQKTASLLKHNQLPIRVFLSGGVDSMLVYSFLKKHTDQFELILCSHVDYDYFWLKNSGTIQKHWAYKQIHHWQEPCLLTSGAPGDEFMLRSPVTADLFFKHHSIKISDLLLEERWKDCLHREYFSRPKHVEIFNSQKTVDQSTKQLHWNLCNTVVNDWQHWHIGNTLTWTPLRDLEIFKTMLRLPVDFLLNQTMNSEFSIEMMENNCPGISRALSDSKNTDNTLSNLVNII